MEEKDAFFSWTVCLSIEDSFPSRKDLENLQICFLEEDKEEGSASSYELCP
jgi:hypothetical protein